MNNRTLRIAVGVLKLSTKYETAELRDRATSWLAVIYPPTLDAYRNRWTVWSKEPKEQFDLWNIALVANAARTTKSLALLPSALFHYLEQYGDNIGAILDAHDAGFALGLKSYKGVLPLLTRDNLSSVLKAHSRIIFFSRKCIYGFAFYKDGITECKVESAARCLRVRSKWAESVDSQSLDGWFSPLVQSLGGLKLCATCMLGAKKNRERGLKELWEQLPGMFDMIGWEELEQASRLA